MTDYRAQIRIAAVAHGLDPYLVEAVVENESSGRADAFRYEPVYYERYVRNSPRWDDWVPRRVASSYGLMQVMYLTALDTGWKGEPEELFIITTNLEVGCTVLARLAMRFNNDIALMLGGYNAGPGGANSLAGVTYAKRVMRIYDRLRVLDNGDAPIKV